MARPTKYDQHASEVTGGVLSPSQVASTRQAGLTPICDDIEEGWRQLAEACGRYGLLGRGRDLDIAAVRLAAEAGIFTNRLRRVIANPGERGAHILEVVLDQLSRSALEHAKREPWTTGEPPTEQAAVVVETIVADASDALEGEESAFEDARTIGVEFVSAHGGPPDPGRELYADEFQAAMQAAASTLADPTWAETAPPLQLVESVKAAALIWHGTAVKRIPLGDEDQWRMIAALAPMARVLVEVIADVQSQISKG